MREIAKRGDALEWLGAEKVISSKCKFIFTAGIKLNRQSSQDVNDVNDIIADHYTTNSFSKSLFRTIIFKAILKQFVT